MNEIVQIKPIVSDYDGQKYKFPDVKTPLDILPQELEARVNAINDLPKGKDGLYGLHIPQKLKDRLLFPSEDEFDGIEWVVRRDYFGAKLSKSNVQKSQQSKRRKLDFSWGSRFCVHPETGEFLFSDYSSMHADIISNGGAHRFLKYLRLSYRTFDNGTSVLLSRAYYNPEDKRDKYDFLKDKEVNLYVLALLIKNGLPADTTVFLSAPRDVFISYGFR